MERTVVTESNLNKSDETLTINIQREWRWVSVVFFATIHLHAIYFIYAVCTSQVYFSTVLYQFVVGQLAVLGSTAGTHRLWSHRSYKARAPLRLLLAFLHTLTLTGSVFLWARTHRVHHKYMDTDADPHNSKKGFLYCHIMWLLLRTHPEVTKKTKTIDVDDMLQDWVIRLQRMYFFPVGLTMSFLVPSLVPIYLWGEDTMMAWFSSVCRCTFTFHVMFSINSFAHLFGSQPYNRHLSARENPSVSLCTVGEGWHNYHHTFPWDYKAQELGNNGYNPTTAFINLCAKLGLAYDLKYPSEELVRKQMVRAQNTPEEDKVEVYGWSDTDMKEEDKKLSRREKCTSYDD